MSECRNHSGQIDQRVLNYRRVVSLRLRQINKLFLESFYCITCRRTYFCRGLNFGLTSQALTRTHPPCALKSWLRRQELQLIGTRLCWVRYFASKAGTILYSFRASIIVSRNGLLAARVACRFASEPWIAGFAKAVFHANFGEDREIYDPEVVIAGLNGLGLNGQLILEQAQTEEE
jgi:hypothetical protein